jgi:hypothetical protein
VHDFNRVRAFDFPRIDRFEIGAVDAEFFRAMAENDELRFQTGQLAKAERRQLGQIGFRELRDFTVYDDLLR